MPEFFSAAGSPSSFPSWGRIGGQLALALLLLGGERARGGADRGIDPRRPERRATEHQILQLPPSSITMISHQQLLFNAAGSALADPQIAFVFITKFCWKVIVSTDFQGVFAARACASSSRPPT